jgi:hypothetical protein
VSGGKLGQPITFSVTERAPASAGAPTGTVSIVDHGAVVAELTLSPEASANARYAYSNASYTLTQKAGGDAYFMGKHPLTAQYVPGGTSWRGSSSRATWTVSQPSYATLAGGVKTATVVPGSGPAIQPGQTANVLYTGYLARNGQVFDASMNHGGGPFSFTAGAGQVVPGFDAGVAGMHVGETRVILIPPAEGYGSAANGPIPPNSTLVFLITLQSIS